MKTQQERSAPTLTEAMTSVAALALDQVQAMIVAQVDCWARRAQEHVSQVRESPDKNDAAPWMVGACTGILFVWLWRMRK